MIKFKLTAIAFGTLLGLSACTLTSEKPQSRSISKETMVKDITYLASDELNGRGNFTQDIEKAASYIAKRFKQIGLQPLATESGFLQSFFLYDLSPTELNVTINGINVKNSSLSLVSTRTEFNWQSLEQVALHRGGAEDDMRQLIADVNKQGGDHLILVNRAHQDWFKRYQDYFARGIRKTDANETGAIVLVLTDETQVTSVNVKASVTRKQHMISNVVGVLPGQELKEEVVLYSAHYDHLGAKGDSNDVIYNGADDDASGTTAVINLAEHFASRKDNERTLMFAAFTAEELGGYGSKYFSKQLDPQQIVAMINIEMIGKPSKFGAGTMWMTGAERSDLQHLLNQRLAKDNQQIYTDPYPKQQLFYRSDNATLAGFGVPAHSFSTTQLEKDKHYHQVSDDIHSLDLESMYQVIGQLAVAVEGLNNGKQTPNRIEPLKERQHGLIF